MKDLNERDRFLEENFGLISGGMLFGLHAVCEKAGSEWDLSKPETMDITVTKENADEIYSWCKAILSGYSVGINRIGIKLIKEAKIRAHEFLYDEANSPDTSIDRKIELVKLTTKS